MTVPARLVCRRGPDFSSTHWKTQRRLSEAALVEQQRHETALRKAEDDVRKAQRGCQATTREAESCIVANGTFPGRSEASFEGRWEVTRVGAQCAKGASVTFSLDIKGTDVSGGSGAITSAGAFKYQRSSGSTGRPMHFTGTFSRPCRCGHVLHRRRHLKGTFTAQRK